MQSLTSLLASDNSLVRIAFVLVVALMGFHWIRRRREDHRARKKLAEAVKLELNVPQTLHPVIDPDICIGSGSCVSACPEGKILGLVGGVGTLVNAHKCIGHGKCAAECPVGAIRLVFGTAERGVDLPEVDEFFETSRAGVYIVGELAGMGLIKNALNQGLEVAARLKETMRAQSTAGGVDVLIVGAGPAGIATAVGCRAAGLSYALLEQGTVGGTVAHYPRHKLVMTETVDLPFYGKFGRKLISKEELIVSFEDLIGRADITIHEKTKLTGIDGNKDNFVATTDRGILSARRVVLAIGRRGTPRKLGVPGEELGKVAYRLIDPQQYRGRRVLVVGGGDSALEAAIQLAEETDARVSISCRAPEFVQGRALNRQRLAAHVKSGRIEAFMSSVVTAVEPETVMLKSESIHRVANDFVIACLGGELPNEFLKSLGIAIHRHHGDRAMANPSLAGNGKNPSGRNPWRARLVYLAVGLAILVGLAMYGGHYYVMPLALRYKEPGHVLLKPSGLWGHGVGVVATLFMFLNFVYPARKRLPWFKGKGTIAPWLRFHAFVGIMSPLVILFHTAFKWSNHLATTTYLSVLVVVITGMVGRYFYGWMRIDAGDVVEAKRLGQRLGTMMAAVPSERRQIEEAQDAPLRYALALASNGPSFPRSLGALFFHMPFDSLRLRRGLNHSRRLFVERATYLEFRADVQAFRRLRTKLQFHRHFKRLMSHWRVLHVVLAIMLVGLIGLHVWVSVRVGYSWIWS